MRIGTIVAMPSEYSSFGLIKDEFSGRSYSVEAGELPDRAEEDRDFAYKLDLWSNDSGLAQYLEED